MVFTIMRSFLLGMNNPHHSDPRFDLYPAPKNCAGWRLWKMLNDRAGTTKSDYVRSFARRNLVRGHRWSKREARESALQTALSVREDTTVVLLGEDVRRAMDEALGGRVRKILIHPQVVDGVVYRCVPHPSGRNHFYNDPAARELVAMLLEELYEKAQRRKRERS